jgi:hypothetical protein
MNGAAAPAPVASTTVADVVVPHGTFAARKRKSKVDDMAAKALHYGAKSGVCPIHHSMI